MAVKMDHALTRIDALVPRDHVVWHAWHAWHAKLQYDGNAHDHLPRVCKQLFAPYRLEPWTVGVFKQIAYGGGARL